MESDRSNALQSLIRFANHDDTLEVLGAKNCAGDCIHHSEIVSLSDGSHVFVKSSQNAGDMFSQEALGLAAIAKANVLRTPHVITAGMLDESTACLVLEAIHIGSPTKDFWQQFGRGFAELHRNVTSAEFGWSSDNYLGSSRQINEARADWVSFFAEHRLGYQIRFARNQGNGSRELFKLVDQLIGRLDKWLGSDAGPPSLLHGDLWSGNYLVDEGGSPTIFDPAVYFGHREADLAMPLLFGGFPREFFSAYHEAWPLESEWRDRVEIYKLYHLLNHLNLFGSGYLDSCLEIARRFANQRPMRDPKC